jgi:DNA-nicking Smr family endonuclease
MAERDEAEATSEFRRAMTVDALEAGDALAYRRDTLPPRTLQRLRRGHFAAQDELDLHWVDARAAEAMLRDFLHHARQQGFGCVRIIHGKGLNGDSKTPVLKNLVDRMLRHRADVLAFASAPANQGGTGAVLVLLAGKK